MDNETFVRDALSGNAVEAQATFNSLMQDRISSKIEAHRQVVASSYFAEPEGEATTQPEETQVDGEIDSSEA